MPSAKEKESRVPVFENPFVKTPQPLAGYAGWGWNSLLGTSPAWNQANHKRLISVTHPSQTIAFGQTGNPGEWTNYIAPNTNQLYVNDGKTIIGWVDGHVTLEDPTIASSTVNGKQNYYWLLQKD